MAMISDPMMRLLRTGSAGEWEAAFLKRLGIWLLLISLLKPAHAAELKAGFARRDITPAESLPMWGYGDRHAAVSIGTLDPLMACALVLEAGATKLAIVSLDLGRSPARKSLNAIRARLKDELGIEHSIIAGSHTHHGPVLELSDEEGKGRGKFDAAILYYAKLEKDIVDVVAEANKGLAPAKIAAGSTNLAGFNRNRHTKIEPKPVDREVTVLKIESVEGAPVALLVNLAAHPTSIEAATLKFSPDFPVGLREELETRTKYPAMFMQGASGDLSTDRKGKNYKEYGAALGVELAPLVKRLDPVAQSSASLKIREQEFKFTSRTDWKNPLIKTAFSLAFFPELVANYLDEYADGIRPRLTVALLNNEIGMVGISGEVFCAHAMRLRERARLNQLFFFGYANGYHQYFPTIEAVSEGGYGADSTVSPVEIGAGEKMINQALIWLYEMRGKMKQ